MSAPSHVGRDIHGMLSDENDGVTHGIATLRMLDFREGAGHGVHDRTVLTAQNGSHRSGNATVGLGISSMGACPTSSSSICGHPCPSSGWRVAYASGDSACPFAVTWG